MIAGQFSAAGQAKRAWHGGCIEPLKPVPVTFIAGVDQQGERAVGDDAVANDLQPAHAGAGDGDPKQAQRTDPRPRAVTRFLLTPQTGPKLGVKGFGFFCFGARPFQAAAMQERETGWTNTRRGI